MQQVEDEVGERVLGVVLKRRLQVGEAGVAVRAEDDDLAVQRDTLRGKLRHGCGDGGHAVRPVEPLAGEERNLRAGFARLNAVAIELELMQPITAGWRCRGLERELRRDEVGLGFFGEFGEGCGDGFRDGCGGGFLFSFEL